MDTENSLVVAEGGGVEGGLEWEVGVSRCMLLSVGEGDGTPLQYSCLKIPWMEEPGGLQSMGSLRVGRE